MRLRRSTISGPGIARKRRGNGFAYYGPDGDVLADDAVLQRIGDLVIPPAWKKVWISSGFHRRPAGNSRQGVPSITGG